MGAVIRNAETVSSIDGVIQPQVTLPDDHMLPSLSQQAFFISGTGDSLLHDRWVTGRVTGPNSARLDVQIPSSVTTMQITTGVMAVTIPSASVAIQTGNVLRQNQVGCLDLTYDVDKSLDVTRLFEVVRLG